MAVSPSRINELQSSLWVSNRTNQEPWAEARGLLQKVQQQVAIYTNSKTPETGKIILETLNALKKIFYGKSKTQALDMLIEIHKKDSSIWKKHIWENADRNSREYQENNNPERYLYTWITPDQVINSPDKLEDPTIKIILVLVSIYGLSLETIRAISMQMRK